MLSIKVRMVSLHEAQIYFVFLSVGNPKINLLSCPSFTLFCVNLFQDKTVGKVLPEIVIYEENGVDAIGMDYSKITPLLVEAIKAQQKEIELLKARLEKLEGEASR